MPLYMDVHNLPGVQAGAVADAILGAFPRIGSVKVTVHKPHAPIAAFFHDVGVVITRSRATAPSR